MTTYFERSKKEWERASEFPVDKEFVYPDHAKVQEFDLHHGKVVYEYGCGGGSDVISYLKRGNYVVGSDIVPKNIEVAHKRIQEAGYTPSQYYLILLEDSNHIPLDDEYADIVSSHGVLHHIIDPLPVVKELHRICKWGGLFYYMLYTDVMWDYFWNLGYIENFMKQYHIDLNEAFGYCTDNIGTPYSRPYTTEQAIELSEQFGFKVIDYNHWLGDHFITVKAQKI